MSGPNKFGFGGNVLVCNFSLRIFFFAPIKVFGFLIKNEAYLLVRGQNSVLEVIKTLLTGLKVCCMLGKGLFWTSF